MDVVLSLNGLLLVVPFLLKATRKCEIEREVDCLIPNSISLTTIHTYFNALFKQLNEKEYSQYQISARTSLAALVIGLKFVFTKLINPA